MQEKSAHLKAATSDSVHKYVYEKDESEISYLFYFLYCNMESVAVPESVVDIAEPKYSDFSRYSPSLTEVFK